MILKNFKSFLNLPKESKLILLKALDFEVNEKGIIISSKDKSPVICKYSNRPVQFDNASILPGSTIIINTNPITLSEYVGEYLEDNE